MKSGLKLLSTLESNEVVKTKATHVRLTVLLVGLLGLCHRLVRLQGFIGQLIYLCSRARWGTTNKHLSLALPKLPRTRMIQL
jgi:hypothetical protein